MAVYTVTNLNDAGAGSLRQAIIDANGAAGTDTIDFAAGLAGGTIVLTSGELSITSDMTIDGDVNGDSAADITISGDADGSNTTNVGDSRVFNISGATVRLDALTLTEGFGLFGANGAAVFANASSGLTIVNSTISDSRTTGSGGGVFALGALTIVNSTISGNIANIEGGGIWANANATVINSTISGNSTNSGNGGGIRGGSLFTIINSTVSGNQAGGGYTGGGLDLGLNATISNSIIAGNAGGADNDIAAVGPSYTYSGVNIFSQAGAGDAQDIIETTLSNIFDASAANPNTGVISGVLADNGGTSQTIAIATGGVAHNSAYTVNLPTDTLDLDNDSNTVEIIPFDGRGPGFLRIESGLADVGAFEIGPLNGPPQITNLNTDQITFRRGGGPVEIDAAGTPTDNRGTAPLALGLTDADSADFDTGNLTVSIIANGVAGEDVLTFDSATVTLSGVDNLPDDGETVTVGGTVIGTIAAGGNGRGGNDLVVSFNASATPALVQTLLREIQYDNANTISPNVSARTVRVTVDDGDGAVSDAQDITVNIAIPAAGVLTDSGQALGSNAAQGVVLADVDGDGDEDAIVVNASGTNQVYLNDGSGTFSDSGQALGASLSVAVASGDIDGDGDFDFVVANYSGQANTVWLNDGAGNFTDSGQTLGALASHGVSLGDLDGDGDLDIFFAEDQGAGNTVWLNDGAGTFSDSGQSLGNGNGYGIELADLDGDGDLDAFVGNKNSTDVVWLNDGSGNFSAVAQALSSADTKDIALGDVDGDGDSDAILANPGANTVWLNDGAGNFTDSGQTLGTGDSWNIALEDIDGDGDLDAVVANVGINRIWTNDGTGTFSDSGQSLNNQASRALAVGDLDGDGDLDAFVGNLNQPDRVWINTNAAPTFDAVLTNLSAAFTFNGDGAFDQLGRSVSGAGDVNGDGFDDVIVGAYGDDNNGTSSGSASVFSGIDGTALFTFDGNSAFDTFGRSVSGAGDVNSDGFDDVVVGAIGDSNTGSARVFSGADGSILFSFFGDNASDLFGRSVSSAGDVNGDGFADVIVGADGDDNNGSYSGSARVLSGADGAVLFTFDGDSADDRFGFSVSDAGDVNGDGFDDVIIGANRDDNNGNFSGSARVLSGLDGTILFSFDGGSANDNLGFSVSASGDVNGDGFDDVIVGAFGEDNNGESSGSARIFSGFDGTVLFLFNGDNAFDQFGQSVSGAGDVNGDGFDDVIVAARLDDNNGTDSGSARVLSGSDGSILFTFSGDSANDSFGYSVSSAGDVNGDGFDDVIVGAPFDDNNGSFSGSARLFTSTGTGRLDSVRAFTEGDAATILDSDVAVADADLDLLNGGNGDYDGAWLNIQRQGGGNGDDLFAFAAMANVTVNGGNLEVLGVAVATFSAVGGVLNIAFTNGNGTTPTTALVNEILQGVTYENSGTFIALGEQELLPLEWVFSDGIDNLTDTINISHSGIGGRVITGTPADDVLNATQGDDIIDGLGANDTVDFSSSLAGVTASLFAAGPQATGGSGTDSFTNIENLSGTGFADDFLGDNGDNTLEGLGGDDILRGRFGDDTLNGGAGSDTLVGRLGSNTLNGGAGDDIHHVGSGDTVNELAGEGFDRVNAYGDFTLGAGSEVELIFDNAGVAQTLTGNELANNIQGRAGDDTLNGGAGLDVLRGGDDSDILNGGADRDMMFGEAGADTFLFTDAGDSDRAAAGRDFVRDFSGFGLEGDQLDLSAIASSFIGTGAFTGTAGQVRFANLNGNTQVYVDTDGNFTTDFMLTITGVHALVGGDFIL